MANILDRLPQNIPGRFFVDASCIDCGICCSNAPAHFRRDDGSGLSHIFRQPATDAESALCLEAVADCPAESIGEA